MVAYLLVSCFFFAIDQSATGGTVSKWNGFEKRDFLVNGRKAFVVVPEKVAVGRPWIWRTEFFGHEPQAAHAVLH